ncbi:MAG TPA: hypothetical protein VFU71_03945 [Burkholderiaceae bacterium]|nr:hypothetical protein [Burkholderiaceae bacterium]
MKRIACLIGMAFCAAALAKLPPSSDEAKAKAAEAAAKTAWSDKVAAYKLCQSMDHVAAIYLADAKKAGKNVQPVATPPCTDPGPFAYTPAGQKPAEAAGAHSPPGKAATPPSTNAPAAEQAPAKKP